MHEISVGMLSKAPKHIYVNIFKIFYVTCISQYLKFHVFNTEYWQYSYVLCACVRIIAYVLGNQSPIPCPSKDF